MKLPHSPLSSFLTFFIVSLCVCTFGRPLYIRRPSARVQTNLEETTIKSQFHLPSISITTVLHYKYFQAGGNTSKITNSISNQSGDTIHPRQTFGDIVSFVLFPFHLFLQ